MEQTVANRSFLNLFKKLENRRLENEQKNRTKNMKAPNNSALTGQLLAGKNSNLHLGQVVGFSTSKVFRSNS